MVDERIRQLEIECRLLDWAGRNDYHVTERIWKETADIVVPLGIVSLIRAKGTKISERTAKDLGNMMSNCNPTFKKYVRTPTGYVGYDLRMDESENVQDEEQTLQRLNEDTHFTEGLELLHGPRIQNWKSDRITFDERGQRAYSRFDFQFDTPGQFILSAEDMQGRDLGYGGREFSYERDGLQILDYMFDKFDEIIASEA